MRRPLPAGATRIGVLADRRQHAVVLPRLLHEIADAESQRLDGDVERRPAGHHEDGKGRVDRVHAREQVQAFAAGGRVARVVEVHQQDVEVTPPKRVEDGRRATAPPR